MNKEFLYMQKLAGVITESEYAAKLEEGNGQFKSLDFKKLTTLFQILDKIPANSGYTRYNMDTGKTTSGKYNIVTNGYTTPEFFKKLKDLQDGLQKGDKEAGQNFRKSIDPLMLYLGERFMPFNIYGGEEDNFDSSDYETLDKLNDALDEMYDSIQYTSKYEDDDIDAANPEWNNLVDAVNNIDLNDFIKYSKK